MLFNSLPFFVRRMSSIHKNAIAAQVKRTKYSVNIFSLRDPSAKEQAKLFEDLHNRGIASFPIFDEESRGYFASIAKSLPFRDVDPYAGPHKVEQDFKFFDKNHALDNNHPFMLAKTLYETWINRLFLARDPRAFSTPFSINEITVNMYHPQSRGIGAHRDHARYLNLVSIFVLEGQGKFFVCSDRNKTDAREIIAPPGSVTLMRASGLFNFTSADRPFHYLSEVTSTRIALIMRQDSKYGAEYEK